MDNKINMYGAGESLLCSFIVRSGLFDMNISQRSLDGPELLISITGDQSVTVYIGQVSMFTDVGVDLFLNGGGEQNSSTLSECSIQDDSGISSCRIV